MKKIKKLYLTIKRKKDLILNKNGHYKLNIFKRIYYASKNFSTNEYYCYNLKINDYKNYISEYERLEGRNINGEYKILLDNKIIFEEVFRNYIKVPTNYAYISNGNIYQLHDTIIDNIHDFICKKETVVLKILNGGGGKGVYIIKSLEKNKYEINGKIEKKQYLDKLIKKCDDSIICEYMKQSNFEKELYDKTINTIRIVCAKAKNEKHAQIIKAVQRIGCKESIPVDNLSSGGYACEIDLKTGELGYAIQKYRKNINIKRFEKHPDSNSQIKGKIIPNWNEIKQQIEDLTNKFPYFKLIAWDVLLTDEGVCIIEGNASSGCTLFQLEHGIKNEKYGEILKSYGVFK